MVYINFFNIIKKILLQEILLLSNHLVEKIIIVMQFNECKKKSFNIFQKKKCQITNILK